MIVFWQAGARILPITLALCSGTLCLKIINGLLAACKKINLYACLRSLHLAMAENIFGMQRNFWQTKGQFSNIYVGVNLGFLEEGRGRY